MGGMDGSGALFPFFMILLGCALLLGALVLAFVRRAMRRRRNNAAPEVTATAAVVDKHIDTGGRGESADVEHHLVSFEQPDGERFELEVPANQFGLLVVGDRGSVTMKGTKYLAFAREIMR